jgi:periplasmic copper chaperone A
MSRVRTVAAMLVVVLAGLFVLAGPAAAHVTVTAPGARPGGTDQEISFRVPVEENSATVALTVAFPIDHPIASVLINPVPGWRHTEKTANLTHPIKTDDGEFTTAVSQITWTAERGHGLQPGEVGIFTVLAGQLPDVDRLVFPAVQTYANGDVVRWIEQAAPGSSAQPEHPAPVLRLGSAPADPGESQPASSSSSDLGPTILSIVALVLAASALGVALVSRAKGRSG